jgi:hypothetical protein
LLAVHAPLRRPHCISDKHVKGSHKQEREWVVFDKRYWPGDLFIDHLIFAMRHEDIDLLLLKRTFEALDQTVIEDYVRTSPTGALARRIWYFYEFLTGRHLDVPDAPAKLTAIDLLYPDCYFTAPPTLSKRHRVRDNLLGPKEFCPMIRRTEYLEDCINLDLSKNAKDITGRAGRHLIARAASFLLLADSRASFEIEGERPPRNRLERWGRAVTQSGKHALSIQEIERLQAILIEDSRFIINGLRPDGVFLGERDDLNDPLPEFIGARPDDLDELMAGMLASHERMSHGTLDPVVQAAAIAFGFVYIHPLQDGNGRLHRYLFHHVLAERKYTPMDMVFPVSSVILDRIDGYQETLQNHSSPLMEFIDWRATSDHNVEVLNDTADLYRYFDCTEAATFLYDCVKRTVEYDLPKEIDYLKCNDAALRRITDIVDMPDRLAQNLIVFIRQNDGILPRRRRNKEFSMLEDSEVEPIETVIREEFEDIQYSDK